MRIAFLTGAGMSAESGIPTFRDALTGLRARFDAEQLATEAAFRRDPSLVWGWYRWRAATVLRAEPNAGHLGIAALQDAHEVAVVTQNVDDLHERAGSREVTHLHGSLFASRCLDCGKGAQPDPILDRLAVHGGEGGREPPPACTACGGMLRPGVVWFGEALPAREWHAAEHTIERCECLVVIGTSGLVQPAASLPALARDAGRRVIEINPRPSAITPQANEHWPLGAAAGMQRLHAALAGEA